jgi:hypothetical protein
MDERVGSKANSTPLLSANKQKWASATANDDAAAALQNHRTLLGLT